MSNMLGCLHSARLIHALGRPTSRNRPEKSSARAAALLLGFIRDSATAMHRITSHRNPYEVRALICRECGQVCPLLVPAEHCGETPVLLPLIASRVLNGLTRKTALLLPTAGLSHTPSARRARKKDAPAHLPLPFLIVRGFSGAGYYKSILSYKTTQRSRSVCPSQGCGRPTATSCFQQLNELLSLCSGPDSAECTHVI